MIRRVVLGLVVASLLTLSLSACAIGQAPGDAETVTPVPLGPPPAPEPTATPGAEAPVGLQPVEEGMVAPDFTLQDLDGVAHSLSDYRGRVVLLSFWASWCGFCRAKVPELNAVYQDLAGQDFAIVSVNLGEDLAHLRQFTAENQIVYPVLSDLEMVVAQQYLVSSIPTSYFLDREGVVRRFEVGALPQADMVAIIQELLAE